MSTNTMLSVGAIDVDKITFGPVDFTGGKVKVDVYRDDNTSRMNRFNRFSLCNDAQQPMVTRYGLDAVRDDQQNPDRRGLMIRVSDPVTVDVLRRIDEKVISAAVKNSREWFGKQGKPLPTPLSDEIVRSRYQPLLMEREDENVKVCKIKVKAGGDWPTKLHLNEDGCYRKNGAKPEHLTEGCEVVPAVSMSYGIWFIPGGKFGLTMQAEEIIVTPTGGRRDDLSHFPTSAPLLMAQTPVKAEEGVKLEEAPEVQPEVKLEDLPATDEDAGPM